MPNPYRQALGGREPVAAMAETPGRISAIVARMGSDDLARSYAPGKWTAAQLLVHLAQAEVALSLRLRMALTSPGYQAQPFDQDAWLTREAATSPQTALAAYLALRALNMGLYERLTPADRALTFSHPQHGTQPVEDLLGMIAGHELHHLKHFEAIAAGNAARA
jgi:hypothetical protein